MFTDFIERGRGRERNVDQLPSCMCHDQGINLNPRYVPWLGIEPTTLEYEDNAVTS